MLATLISALFAIPAQAAPGTVDVGVALTSAPASGSNVRQNTNVVYTITVTNTDDVATLASDVVVTDDLGNGRLGERRWSRSLRPLCPLRRDLHRSGGDRPRRHVDHQHHGRPPSRSAALNNDVSVTETADLDGTNDTAGPNTTTVVPALADVTIAKSHTGTVTPGSDVTYNLVVSNAGPDTAAGVVATDTLAADRSPSSLLLPVAGGSTGRDVQRPECRHGNAANHDVHRDDRCNGSGRHGDHEHRRRDHDHRGIGWRQ